jgi:hypothetical protein
VRRHPCAVACAAQALHLHSCGARGWALRRVPPAPLPQARAAGAALQPRVFAPPHRRRRRR